MSFPSQSQSVFVTWLFRSPGRFHSIEEVFKSVATSLPSNIHINSEYAPRSRGSLFDLFLNMIWVCRISGFVNHITGDIHYLAIILRRRTTILTIHDLRFLDRNFSIKRFLIKLIWLTMPVWRVGYVTVISEFTKRELIKHLGKPSSKITVIPNPVSSAFEFSEKVFSSGCPVILQIGTTENKNLNRVAAALRGIKCKLQILGEPTHDQIKYLNDNEIDFSWVSNLPQSEVVGLYRRCDLVCFVSTYEGFGMPIIEAQAVGRPVITSNVTSLPEVAGSGALLVNPFDISSIRSGVLRLIAEPDLRRYLISEGRKNVLRYSPGHVALLYARLYHDLVSGLNS